MELLNSQRKRKPRSRASMLEEAQGSLSRQEQTAMVEPVSAAVLLEERREIGRPPPSSFRHLPSRVIERTSVRTESRSSRRIRDDLWDPSEESEESDDLEGTEDLEDSEDSGDKPCKAPSPRVRIARVAPDFRTDASKELLRSCAVQGKMPYSVKHRHELNVIYGVSSSPTLSDISLLEVALSNCDAVGYCTIMYRLNWDLPAYLKKYFPPGQRLGSILTLTGGDADAYSSSCKDYIHSTFPEIGPYVLECLEEMLLDSESGMILVCIFLLRHWLTWDPQLTRNIQWRVYLHLQRLGI